MSTSYLGLTLPAPNSTQWGTSINVNFENIDTAYGTLYNQLSSLRLQLGQMGLYYADPQYSGALQFTTAGDAVTSAFITKQADPSTPIYLYQNSSYTDKLNSIVDYTMFVVTLPDNKQSSQFTMGGERWGHNDIAVKMTRFDSTTQRNITSLYKMAQSIGGYYRPVRYIWDAVSATPSLEYARENAVQSSNRHISPALYVKPMSVENNRISFSYCTRNDDGDEEELGPALTLSYPQITTKAVSAEFKRTNSNNTYTYSTGISSANYLLTDVRFFYKNKPIILDYTVSSLNAYVLLIDITLLPIDSTQSITCYVSYAAKQA
jgi:hypothetical protein